VDIASVVLFLVLVVECAQVPKRHVLSIIVSFVSKSVDSLADLTCMYLRGSVSSYESWEMSGYCISCVDLGVGG
jgi:hypothetical protein